MRIELLGPSREEEYAALVHARSESLVYASLPYRNFLRCVLPTSRDVYLVADDGGRMVGVLPAFLATVEGRGKVLNSLPFFGSHGGVMTARDVDDDREVRLALLQAFNDLAESERVLSSTLISNPLSADADFYRQHHRHNYLDQRICQFTGLPVDYSSDQQPDRLLSFFHVKTRNAVRKGLKGGFDIRHGDKPALLKQLHDLHVANMTAIGGIPKEWSVFQAITEEFSYDDDYRVYVAEQDGHVAAALLLLLPSRSSPQAPHGDNYLIGGSPDSSAPTPEDPHSTARRTLRQSRAQPRRQRLARGFELRSARSRPHEPRYPC